MTLSPHARSTAAALLRWLTTWLALIVLVQGFAAAQALGRGPLHQHHQSGTDTQRGHHHDNAERHHHVADNALDMAFVVSEPDLGVDIGAFAITAALALMALAGWRAAGRAARPVFRSAPSWAWQTSVPAAPRRPPRLA